MSDPVARVVVLPDGTLSLDDPVALAVAQVVEDHNLSCLPSASEIIEDGMERIKYFFNRLRERGDDPMDLCVIVSSVDDHFGGALTDFLMPNTPQSYWDDFRKQGLDPISRGLADRAFITEFVETYELADPSHLNKLKSVAEYVLVIVTRRMATVFVEQDLPNGKVQDNAKSF